MQIKTQGLRASFFRHVFLLLMGSGLVGFNAPLSNAAESAAAEGAPIVMVDRLDLSRVEQMYFFPAKAGQACSGKPMTMKGHVYPHGVGTFPDSEIEIALDGEATKFSATIGIDDDATSMGTAVFSVWLDGEKKFDSGIIRRHDPVQQVTVDLTGGKRLKLIVNNGGDEYNYDFADWADAELTLLPGSRFEPHTLLMQREEPPALATEEATKPAIHGARVVGATPGRPFLHLIPATGAGPLEHSAENLPQGLQLDSATGIISGSLVEDGETKVRLTVRGAAGQAQRTLTIIGGQDKLARTPPMGWNSWNVWGISVDDAKIRQAADAMVSSGLAAHGYQYINIDDGWTGGRDADGRILPNEKFPDMKGLADYVHAKGLKLGIYSSPGPLTCGQYLGAYGHEAKDAQTWGEWGVDYIKYDWCSYASVVTGNDREAMMQPYRLMHECLDRTGRDIVYSLCQYGGWEVWKWGAEVGGQLWRTTGDVSDNWKLMSAIGFDWNGPAEYAGPGRWNDPDMLVVGNLGWGPNPRPTALFPNEQITHVTLWCMQAAPLLIGCDMTTIDAFTQQLLTNSEVLEVDQDPLGRQARRIKQEGPLEVWARPLFDGTHAVALFNRDREGHTVGIDWATLGLSEAEPPVRNLWQQKDLGRFTKAFSAPVPGHGALLLKVGEPERTDY